MIQFLAAAGILALATLAAIAWPLMRGRGAEASRAARDAAVFRDQLAELERDIARGTIAEAEARGSRAEIARRLIAASARAGRDAALGPAPRSLSLRAVGAALVSVPAVAALVYAATGAPGRQDVPFASRPAAEQRAGLAQLPGQARMSQAEAERLEAERVGPLPPLTDPESLREAALLAQLVEVIAARPEDVEGRKLLADAWMRRARFAEAARVYGEIERIEGPRATAGVVADRLEALVLAAGGYVSPEAEAAISRALSLDAAHPTARYYAGLALAQRGRLAEAVGLWERLRDDSPADAPWLPAVDDILADARAALGPAGRPGPDAAAAAAVQAMGAEDQRAFMADRIAALEQRLGTEGGPPEDWVMLIRSYRNFGDDAAARRVYALSQQRLEGSEAGFVREQALVLGIAVE